MLALLSPAKKLLFEDAPRTNIFTHPDLLDDTKCLIKNAQRLSRNEIARMMKLSDKLADLNYQRFRDFTSPFTLSNARQAIHVFKGDTYIGLNALTLSKEELKYAQEHIRILSGLYGLLRPLDLLQPYRLEMGTRFEANGTNNLYDFWGTRITDVISKSLANHKEKTIINLASKEYFKSVKTDCLKHLVITPIFKEIKEGKARVIGLYAKRARGMMARYIVTDQIESSDYIKDFSADGYIYQPKISTQEFPVFTRPQP